MYQTQLNSNSKKRRHLLQDTQHPINVYNHSPRLYDRCIISTNYCKLKHVSPLIIKLYMTLFIHHKKIPVMLLYADTIPNVRWDK